MTGAPIYLVSACATGEEFVAAFRRYADKTGLFVPIGEPLPPGRRGRFAVTLKDGGVMIEGDAEVISAARSPSVLHGRVGMTLRFVAPDEPSQAMLADLVRARLSMKPLPPSVGPRPADVPAEPRPVPPPPQGRVDAVNALAECVAIGDPELIAPMTPGQTIPPPLRSSQTIPPPLRTGASPTLPPPRAAPTQTLPPLRAGSSQTMQPLRAESSQTMPPSSASPAAKFVMPSVPPAAPMRARSASRPPERSSSDTMIAVAPPEPPSTIPPPVMAKPVVPAMPPPSIPRTPTKLGTAPIPKVPAEALNEAINAVPVPTTTPQSAPTEIGGALVDLSALSDAAAQPESKPRAQTQLGVLGRGSTPSQQLPSPLAAPTTAPRVPLPEIDLAEPTDLQEVPLLPPEPPTSPESLPVSSPSIALPEAAVDASVDALADRPRRTVIGLAVGSMTHATLAERPTATTQAADEPTGTDPIIEELAPIDDWGTPAIDAGPQPEPTLPPEVALPPEAAISVETIPPGGRMPSALRAAITELAVQSGQLPRPSGEHAAIDATIPHEMMLPEPAPTEDAPPPVTNRPPLATPPGGIRSMSAPSAPSEILATAATLSAASTPLPDGRAHPTSRPGETFRSPVTPLRVPAVSDDDVRATEAFPAIHALPTEAFPAVHAPSSEAFPAVRGPSSESFLAVHARPTEALLAPQPPFIEARTAVDELAASSPAVLIPPADTAVGPAPSLEAVLAAASPAGMTAATSLADAAPPDGSAIASPAASPLTAPADASSPANPAGGVLPSGDWTIAIDPDAPDGWSDPFATISPHDLTDPSPHEPPPHGFDAPSAAASGDADPSSALHHSHPGAGALPAEPKVQIDPTLIEPAAAMPAESRDPRPGSSTHQGMQPFPATRPVLDPRALSAYPTGQVPVIRPAQPAEAPAYGLDPSYQMVPVASLAVPAAIGSADPRYASETAMPARPRRRAAIVAISAMVAAGVGIAAVVATTGHEDTTTARAAGRSGAASASAPPTADTGSAAAGSAATGSAATGSAQLDTTAAPAATCFVDVSSTPPGADIILGDTNVVGTTPQRVSLPCGAPIDLLIRKARLSSTTRTVTPTTQGAVVRVALAKQTFSVRVNSTPPGATITLNGKPVGVTPTTVRVPAFETSTLQLNRDGYEPDAERVAPKANGTAVHAELKKLAGKPR